MSLRAPPGAAFEYSNANYVVVGLIVQVVSGEPYGVYLTRHVFGPLGMQRSFASPIPREESNRAAGHRYWFGMPQRMADGPFEPASAPSGSVWSCAADMATYLLVHVNEGRHEGRALLSPERMAELHTPQLGTTYGLGWFVTDWDGPRRIWHGGGMAGFSTSIAFEPASGWGVVLLANGFSYFGNTRRYEIGAGVLRQLCGREPRPVPPDWWGPGLRAALSSILALELAGLVLCVVRRRRPAGGGVRRSALSRWSTLLLLGAGASFLLGAPHLLFGGSLHLTGLLQPDVALLLEVDAIAALLLGMAQLHRSQTAT